MKCARIIKQESNDINTELQEKFKTDCPLVYYKYLFFSYQIQNLFHSYYHRSLKIYHDTGEC